MTDTNPAYAEIARAYGSWALGAAARPVRELTEREQWVVERSRRRHLRRRAARWNTRAKRLNRRAKRVGASGRVSGTDLMTLVQGYDSTCAYCGSSLTFSNVHRHPLPVHAATIDHVTPLRDGGSGSVANMVPACYGCNTERSRVADHGTLPPPQAREKAAIMRSEGVGSSPG